MSGEHPELDDLQAAYKAAVEAWILSIRNEEALASANHSLIEIDKWEATHLDEDQMRNSVKGCEGEIRGRVAHQILRFLGLRTYCPKPDGFAQHQSMNWPEMEWRRATHYCNGNVILSGRPPLAGDRLGYLPVRNPTLFFAMYLRDFQGWANSWDVRCRLKRQLPRLSSPTLQ